MKEREALDMIAKLQMVEQTMESACKRIDELKAENKSLKEALADHIPDAENMVAQPAVASEQEKYCLVCQGCGQVDTGIMESPVTICNACNGTGFKAQPAAVVEPHIAEQHKQEPKCNPHPKAPHGFNRNASHANDRYTCECEGWDAYDAGYQAGVSAGIEASMGQEPPQRKPLTDEQRNEIARQADENDWHDYDIIDAVEAAHGIT